MTRLGLPMMKSKEKLRLTVLPGVRPIVQSLTEPTEETENDNEK